MQIYSFHNKEEHVSKSHGRTTYSAIYPLRNPWLFSLITLVRITPITHISLVVLRWRAGGLAVMGMWLWRPCRRIPPLCINTPASHQLLSIFTAACLLQGRFQLATLFLDVQPAAAYPVICAFTINGEYIVSQMRTRMRGCRNPFKLGSHLPHVYVHHHRVMLRLLLVTS